MVGHTREPGDHVQRRESLRLPEYDYRSPGAYFVTICVHQRRPVLGTIERGVLRLSAAGEVVARTWRNLPKHYRQVRLDAFVVMPNHIHGIIWLKAELPRLAVGAGLRPAPTPKGRHALPEIIRALKSFSARRINGLRGTPGQPVWQRGYYEHVIRNDQQLSRLRQYIAANVERWEHDRHHR